MRGNELNDTIFEFEVTDTELTGTENIDDENYLPDISEKKMIRDLFVLFRSRGDEQSAADLWDEKIRKNFIVKPV